MVPVRQKRQWIYPRRDNVSARWRQQLKTEERLTRTEEPGKVGGSIALYEVREQYSGSRHSIIDTCNHPHVVVSSPDIFAYFWKNLLLCPFTASQNFITYYVLWHYMHLPTSSNFHNLFMHCLTLSVQHVPYFVLNPPYNLCFLSAESQIKWFYIPLFPSLAFTNTKIIQPDNHEFTCNPTCIFRVSKQSFKQMTRD